MPVLVSGTARVRWHVAEDANGWRVALARSTIEALYATLRRCCRRPDGDWRRHRAIRPLLPHRTSRFSAAVETSCARCAIGAVPQPDVLRPDDPQARNDLVATFGRDAERWSRIVPVDGPVPSRLIMAPVGPTWTVIDVTPGAAS